MTARSRPEFANQWFAAGLYEVAQYERDDDGVVELTGNWDEVRDEVERERQVTDERDQDQFPASSQERTRRIVWQHVGNARARNTLPRDARLARTHTAPARQTEPTVRPHSLAATACRDSTRFARLPVGAHSGSQPAHACRRSSSLSCGARSRTQHVSTTGRCRLSFAARSARTSSRAPGELLPPARSRGGGNRGSTEARSRGSVPAIAGTSASAAGVPRRANLRL